MKRVELDDVIRRLRYQATGCCECRPHRPVRALIDSAGQIAIAFRSLSPAIALTGLTRFLRAYLRCNYFFCLELLIRFTSIILYLVVLVVLVVRPQEQIATVKRRRQPSLKGIVRFADYLPMKTRRSIKAMAGDYEVEIRRMRRERRHAAARWNFMLAWLTALWMALRGPAVALGLLLIKQFTSPR